MDGVKDVLSFLGAVFGLISALIPLLGYLADKRRRSSDQSAVRTVVSQPVPEPQPGVAIPAQAVEPLREPRVDRAGFDKAQGLVRTPAIVMIVVGAMSLTTNLATAGVGFIDQFITPLGIRPVRDQAVPGAPDGPFGDRPLQPGAPGSDQGNAVLGIIGFVFFSFASAIAIWSGYSMLKLRNYWLALAGSVALVPGSCTCCLLGIPSGIWSFVVLLKPEVKGAFH